MKKTIAKKSILGAFAACAIASMLMISLAPPAVAQNNNNNPVGVMAEPINLTDDGLTTYEVMIYAWGRSHAPSSVETTIEITFTGMGPAGPYEVVRKHKITRSTVLDGKVDRIRLVEFEHGWDGYYNGEFVLRLNGLPPGEPDFGTMVRVYTTWDNPGPGAVVGGSSQSFDANGKSSGWGKSHELSGNVTLMK
jgi:hypothetical protein